MNEDMNAAWLEISQMLGETTKEELDVFLRTWQRAVQAEREACAKFLESTQLGSLPEDTALHYARLLKGFAEGIRARRTHEQRTDHSDGAEGWSQSATKQKL